VQDLAGKVAIVTGAAQGIGRATALRLARAGAYIVAADIQAEKGQNVINEIQEAGGSAHFVHADLAEHEQIRGVVASALERRSRIDIVVNNAYWSKHGNVVELPEADWDRSMAVMVKAIYLFGKYSFPAMIEAGGGAMVNIGSVHGFAASPRYPVYDAAKAAVINLTRQMALDYGPHNIRVNAICPGWIITEEIPPNPEGFARATAIYPLRRTGVPDDIAKVVHFLVSDYASFVTGHALVADGGLTAQLQDTAANLAYGFADANP
jgi:NAD(P)-dependent dehydrogenase (short-subunit alcohol dehydrogenase family)